MARAASRAALAGALALALCLPLGASEAAAQVTAPAPGSAQRRAILEALRPTIARELRSPVEFVVRELRVERGWALVVAEPQRPGGGAIDGRHLPYSEDRDGLNVCAVMRLVRGRWRIHDHVIGPTDVWFCGMQGSPPSLLRC